MAAATDVGQGDSSSGGGGGGTLHLRLLAMGVIALVSLLGCSLPTFIYYMHHGHGKGPATTAGAAPTERLPVFSLLKVSLRRWLACACVGEIQSTDCVPPNPY